MGLHNMTGQKFLTRFTFHKQPPNVVAEREKNREGERGGGNPEPPKMYLLMYLDHAQGRAIMLCNYNNRSLVYT